MAPRYRAEVDEEGHPSCPKTFRLRPLDPVDYDSSSACPSQQASPRDISGEALSSPTPLKPLRSVSRSSGPHDEKRLSSEELGCVREPSSSSTARQPPLAKVPTSPVTPVRQPARSALRSREKPPDCSNPQEPADGDESPTPCRSAMKQKKDSPEDANLSSPCEAALDLASPPASAPASPTKAARWAASEPELDSSPTSSPASPSKAAKSALRPQAAAAPELDSPPALPPKAAKSALRPQAEATLDLASASASPPKAAKSALRPQAEATPDLASSPSSTPTSPPKAAKSALRWQAEAEPDLASSPASTLASPPKAAKSALRRQAEAEPDLASSPASTLASPPKAAKSALRGGSRSPAAPPQEAALPFPEKPAPRSALKKSDSNAPPPRPGRKISVMSDKVDAVKQSNALQSLGALEEVAEEAPEPQKGFKPRPKPKARAGQRLSIWEDPLGDSARGVLYRVYRFAEQQWLWEVELENSKKKEMARSSVTMDVELPDENLDDSPLSPRHRKDDAEEVSQMRRPSRVVLKQVNAVAKLRLAGAAQEEQEQEESQPKEQNPLREILTSKKVDANRLREAIDELEAPDRLRWLEAKLDIGPPMVPSALWHVIAMGRPDLVSLVLDNSVDVNKVYDGTTIYMGSIKPGSTALECVKNRKGRFVGTMLGDRLELIEGFLMNASKKQKERDTNVPKAVFSDKEIAQKRGKRITTTVCNRGETVYTHTQGHPMESYEIEENVGPQESCATCLSGFHKDTFNPVAIKVTLKPENGAGQEAQIWEEISILRKLQHSNVISLRETFEDDNEIFVVLELCKGGPLFDRLLNESGKSDSLQERHLLRLIRQLADSVCYIHHRQICHRDIQPCNFLLHDQRPLQEGIVKLIDFSTAKEFGNNCPAMKTKICTPSYVAPEILHRGEIPYTERVDVWSLGVVFFVVLCGSLPFQGTTEVETLKKVRRGVLKFKPEAIWDTVSEEAKDCVEKMVVKKAEERWTASQVTEHPWLSRGREE